MANLISPGVLVTVTDESYYVPAFATTVPLFIIATADEKTRADGVTPAEGTYESNVVRTITSVKQSMDMYGIPKFWSDSAGNQLHGDARNEYGLFALNQYLGVGNLSYVIRANVNLNDNYADLLASWYAKTTNAATTLEILANTLITNYNNQNGYIPSQPQYKTTINQAELLNLANEAMQAVYVHYSFRNLETLFENNHTLSPLEVFDHSPSTTPGDWFNYAPTGIFKGLAGMVQDWISGNMGTVVATEWTPAEANSMLNIASQIFQHTKEFLNSTRLGATDAQRRVAIVTTLQQAINSNQEIRSDMYEYNIIICPGYHELCDEMLALTQDIKDEAFVVGETPLNINPDDLATWTGKRLSNNIGYYYPHGLASNLDGVDVTIAASGIALRTITYSDNVSDIWFAPAGVNRGRVFGVSALGYVKGSLGTPTTFEEVNLTQGQRDNLYKFGTDINSIANLPAIGMVVWGQKTTQGVASALDRINVSRLVKYIKRALRKQLVAFLFEPNDKITRDNAKAMVDNFLVGIMTRRGLYDFAVVCDLSNNTPDRIDRNELWIDIALKPMKAIEFIYVPIRIVNTGAVLPST